MAMKILLAIDGSSFSDAAVEEIATRPWPADSEVRIVSVVEPPLLPTVETWVPPDNYIEALETYGYRALTAADGTEAVALYAQHKDEIEVVLTDLMMPYMDGPVTIRALQKLNPKVRIIASSGLAESGRAIEGVKMFLPKPYTAERLLKALAEVIGTR
jgi:CheY-like chemotaxis protein